MLSVNNDISPQQSNVKVIQTIDKNSRKNQLLLDLKNSLNILKLLKKYDIIMSLRTSWNGKNFLAVSVAITLLMEKKVERVILSRPAVEAGEKLGFLPGDMKEKVDPYLRPLYDALYELFGADKSR